MNMHNTEHIGSSIYTQLGFSCNFYCALERSDEFIAHKHTIPCVADNMFACSGFFSFIMLILSDFGNRCKL